MKQTNIISIINSMSEDNRKYKMNSAFAGMHRDFIRVSVNSMYIYECNMHKRLELLTADEEMDFYLMTIGAMQSEIGVY